MYLATNPTRCDAVLRFFCIVMKYCFVVYVTFELIYVVFSPAGQAADMLPI